MLHETRDGLAETAEDGFCPPLFDYLKSFNQEFKFMLLAEWPMFKVDHDGAHSEGVALLAEHLDGHLGFFSPSEGEHHDGAPYVDGFVAGIECNGRGLDRLMARMREVDWFWRGGNPERTVVVLGQSEMDFSFKGAKAAARASARDAFDLDRHQVPVVEPGEPGRGVAGAQ